jgi:hypothetical protein
MLLPVHQIVHRRPSLRSAAQNPILFLNAMATCSQGIATLRVILNLVLWPVAVLLPVLALSPVLALVLALVWATPLFAQGPQATPLPKASATVSPQPTPTEKAAQWDFYELQMSQKRIFGAKKTPLPGFEQDALVYLVNRQVSTVIGKARVIKASISRSTSQHFIELNVLQPQPLPAPGNPALKGALVVLPISLEGPLSHLKFAAGVEKSSVTGTSSTSQISNTRQPPIPANSVVGLGLETGTHVFHHLQTLLGVDAAPQTSAYTLGVTFFPPLPEKELRWLNWFGAGYEFVASKKVEFSAWALGKREVFRATLQEQRAYLLIRAHPAWSSLWRLGLKVVPWKKRTIEVKSLALPTLVKLSDSSVELYLLGEANPLARVVSGFQARIPLKSKLSLESVNSTEKTSNTTADNLTYWAQIYFGFREHFSDTGNTFVWEALAGGTYSFETFEAGGVSETSRKLFLPWGRLEMSYLIR